MQTYFLVGAGGTGTHLLPALLTYLRNHHTQNQTEYQLVIADGDAFDTKNLDRQIFDEHLVTINKAEAMLQMYPGHPIIAVSRYIGAVDIQSMIQDNDIVLICADNYSVRALIADHIATLPNAVVINAGNEKYDGSVQLWVRANGKNMTPAITYAHPEIRFVSEDDRAAMTCAQAAALPGGGQTIVANMTAATYMLLALQRFHSNSWMLSKKQKPGSSLTWTELQFDLVAGTVHHLDIRARRNWQQDPPTIEDLP